MDSFIHALERCADHAVARLEQHPPAARALDGSASARELATYYATAYHAVSHAPELLRAAYERVRAEGGQLELLAALQQKCGEELGHHTWIADDLRAIGHPLEAAHTPHAGVAAGSYVAGNMALIAACGASFLGAAWVLENLAVRCAGRAADNLQRAARIPGIGPGGEGVSFFRLHYEADQHHTEELAQVLGRIHDTRVQSYVLLAGELTSTLYADFFA